MAVSEVKSIAFPFKKGAGEFPASSSSVDAIEDSIRNILLTAKGERYMRPTFGVGIYSYVFENLTEIMKARLSRDIRQALNEHERRIRVLIVKVLDGDDENTLECDIVYSAAGEVQNLSMQVSA